MLSETGELRKTVMAPTLTPSAGLGRLLSEATSSMSSSSPRLELLPVLTSPTQGLIIIPTQGREADLKRIYSRDWFVQAPLVLCACAIADQGWVRMDGKPYVDVDVTIAMDHLILAATDLGLGTCWIAAFDPDAAREVLDLPEGVEPVVFTPLGYPADRLRPKERKALSELVRYEE